ncbi:nitrate/nitrite transporter [Prosthecobacter sp.]|uniref:nitrate/nitrite transporter n=1 Tax=Prosthecobacter sp. TaxID=1965333 RepID=UPI0037847B74
MSENNASAASRSPAVWTQVIAGSFLMLATLPGRTQGLGLITEPLLKELQLSKASYAHINLWATLLGSLACLPVGWWLDRRGPRLATAVLLVGLSAVVWAISAYPSPPPQSVVMQLFGLILLTRAFGQSALSVVSIGVAGAAFRQGRSGAAATYTILLSVLFMVAFGIIGKIIVLSGWRVAWADIAIALLVLTPLIFILPNRIHKDESQTTSESGFTLAESLRQPAFWLYSAGIALFAGVQAGIGLFNEALLAERGFDRATYHQFLAGTAIISLIGQGLGGGTRWMPLHKWLGLALIAQAIGLSSFSIISGTTQLWVLAAIMGISAGIITVAFFAIWPEVFGKRHLGRIMGVAQTLTVLASALGPLLLERGASLTGTFTHTLLYLAAPISFFLGLLTLWLRPQSPPP